MIFVWMLALSGLLLVFLEFFLPGAVMAVGGAILLLSSLIVFQMENSDILGFIVYLAILAALVCLVIRFALWRIKATAKNGTIYLESDQEGFQASSFPSELIGKEGIADTDLKPSGHILIEGHRYNAVSKIGYIDKETPIEVLSGTGSHLVVQSKGTSSAQL
jgi:membrane-bound serine protease (ClpP class)